MAIKWRPLGVVKEIINAIGLDLSYVYDDLVFVDHSLIIIKFHDQSSSVIELYFNEDCDLQMKEKLLTDIQRESLVRELQAINRGWFRLKENPETEELEITFLEESLI